MARYMTTHIWGRDDPSFVRDENLEKTLREKGLTFSTTLDWGSDVNYVHIEAESEEAARNKIIGNKADLERAYKIQINLQTLYIAPESI